MLFDGRKFAKDREILLREKVKSLSRKPVLVSVLVGENRASELYTKMKKGVAERVGVEFEVVRVEVLVGLARHILPDITEDDKLSLGKFSELVKNKIRVIGARDEVDGVMVQLPFPASLDGDTEEILTTIEIEKDVDGLRWQESGVMPATVRAVMDILGVIAEGNVPHNLDFSPKSRELLPLTRYLRQDDRVELDSVSALSSFWGKKFVVVGYTGNVGAPLVSFLRKRGIRVEGINSKTENVSEILRKAGVVISCVGKPGLIKADDVSENTVVVDVGIDMIDGKPKGDMGDDVYKKAVVAVSVPGGVGPVTVVSLLENLVDLAC